MGVARDHTSAPDTGEWTPPDLSVRAYTDGVPTRQRSMVSVPLEQLAPALKPALDPVVDRLDSLEKTVLEIRGALDVQFKRTAAIQAQLDRLLAELAKSRS